MKNDCTWDRTDDTQYCKIHNEDNFEYVETLNLNNEVFVINHRIIDFTDYSEEEMLQYIRPYGYNSIEHLIEIYGSSYKQIVCECIFESLDETRYFSSLDKNECIKVLEQEFNIEVDDVIL